MTAADLRALAGDAGITDTGAYCEWLEGRLLRLDEHCEGLEQTLTTALNSEARLARMAGEYERRLALHCGAIRRLAAAARQAEIDHSTVFMVDDGAIAAALDVLSEGDGKDGKA